MPIFPTRRMIDEDRGAPAGRPTTPTRPPSSGSSRPPQAAPTTRPNARSADGDFLDVPRGSPARPPALTPSRTPSVSLSNQIRSQNQAGAAIEDLALRTHDTPAQAAAFLYADAARYDPDEDDTPRWGHKRDSYSFLKAKRLNAAPDETNVRQRSLVSSSSAIRSNSENAADPYTELAQTALAEYEQRRTEIIQQWRSGEITPQMASALLRDYRDRTQRVNQLFASLNGSEDPESYRSFLQSIFGFQINLGAGDAQLQIQQLTNLAQASVYTIDYFSRVTGESGFQLFNRIFSNNPGAASAGGGRVQINLGSNNSYYGFVPLPETFTDANERRSINLGANVSIATIVHEFGHHLDRWFDLNDGPNASGITGYFTAIQDGYSNMYRLTNREYNLNLLIVQALQGFAAKNFLPEELFADLFMTAVLSGTEQTVYSLNLLAFGPSDIDLMRRAAGSTFQDCETLGGSVQIGTYIVQCEQLPVAWRDDNVAYVIDETLGNFIWSSGDSYDY